MHCNGNNARFIAPMGGGMVSLQRDESRNSSVQQDGRDAINRVSTKNTCFTEEKSVIPPLRVTRNLSKFASLH